MARQKRYNRKKDLLKVPVLIEETGITSKYFQIYDVPEELPMGKSSFLIGGSQLLVPQIKLQIEIIDSAGGVIYSQPVFGYTEGTSKRIAIEVYEDTAPGRCQLVVLGEIDASKVDFNIPAEFRGKYNLRYTRDLSVNLTIPNTLPIRFYRTPKATVQANSKGVLELDVKPTDTVTLTGIGKPKSHVNQEVPITNIDGSITYPGIDSRTKNIRAIIEQNKASSKEGGGGNFLTIPPTQQDPPGDYSLTLSSAQKAEVSMIGQNVLINSPSVDYSNSEISSEESHLYNVPSAFSSSVLDVTDENTLTLLDSFYVTKKGEEPPTKIPAALESVSITATRQTEGTPVESVFNFYDVADMLLTDLRNFSGDVNKVRIFTRSDAAQSPSQWNFIKEIFLEAKEELYDTGSLLRSGNMGYFINQDKIDDHWQGYSGEFGGTSGGAISLTRDNSKIMNAMDISGSNRTFQHDLLVQSKKPMSLQKNVRYAVSMKVYGDAKSKLKGATTDSTKGKFQIFISGSGIPANTDLPQNYGRLLGNLELPSDESNGQGSYNFELVEASYISRLENNAYLQLRMPSGRWKVAEVSVKPSTSTNFSPEVFKCYAELPVAQQRPDFYQFLVEFYDVNNNKADVTAISERVKFEGANLTIQGDNNLLSGSMFIGNTLLSGIEAGGGSSAYIRSLGYFGFDKAESLASGGFMFWSGSVIPDHETYDGVGIELHNDETKASGNDSYLRFKTRDENGNSLFRVKTDEFFFGNAGQHISGSGGNIQISSSKFYLGSDTQFVSGSDGNIEISSSNFHLTSTGDVTMSGTITADAGYIAGWQIVGNKLSGSNVTLDAAGAGLYKSDADPDAYPQTGYYIDFTPGTNYYIRMGPHFAVSSSGVLIASGAMIEGQLTASSGLIANWNIGDNAIYKYTISNTWTGMSSTGPTRFFAGSTTLAASGSAPFNVKESGEVTASSGLIGGWSLSANSLISPNSRMTMSANPGNERITVRRSTGSAADTNFEMVRIGEISDAAGDRYGIKIYDGTGVYNDDTKQGQVVLLGEQGNMIGGWEVTDTQIRTIPASGFGGQFYEGESGLIIHSSGRLESADFASNLKGWRIDSLGNGTAEFENCRIRGTLSTAVFEKESVNVVGGQLMVANASALGALKSGSIIIAGAETASASDVTMSMDNVSGFAPGEIIKAKLVGETGFSVEYLQVTGSMRFSHPSSSVSESLAGYDLGAIDPDGLAGEIYVGRAFGGIVNVSSSVSTITEPMTQLAASGSTDRITVASSASFATQQIIKIDEERMKITQADGLGQFSAANTMGVVRDYHDTDNMAHDDNSAVWVIDTDKEFLAGLISTASPYNAGQVFVSTGKYDTDKRGSGYILMNANPNDMSTPYIDIVERTGSGVYDLSLKTRLGDLSGLSSGYLYGDDEPGFGIYTENGFFSGAITAQTGSFAGVVHVATVQGGLETGEKISIGRQVSGQNDGIYINNNNYWYTTGAWKVGGGTNYISLDNATAGNISIASQTFNLDATDLDISSTSKYIKIGHDAGNGQIVLQGGSTSYIEIGAANKLTLKTDATDQFMVFGSKTSFTEFDQSTAGFIMGMDSTTPKFELVGTSGEYISFDGANLTMNGSITITSGPLSTPGDFATKTNLAGATVSASNAQSNATSAGQASAAATEASASSDATSKANIATAAGQAAAAATEASASTDATEKANAASASNAANIFTTSAGAVYKPPAPSGAGLYLGSTHLGYFNGSAWKTYMASSGDFYLAGAGSNGLTWDYSANTLTIDGAITVRTGYFGDGTNGFTVNSDYFANGKTTLTDGNAGVYVGIDGISLGASSVFMVDDDGALTATSATITGTITAEDGFIGTAASGFTLNATEFHSGKTAIDNTTAGIYIGTNGIALGSEGVTPQFSVTSAGALVASSATITGDITATAGAIAGWSIGSSKIFKQTAVTDVQPNYAISLDSTNQHLIFQSGSYGSVTDGHYTSAAIMTEMNQDQDFTNEATTYTEGKDSFINLNVAYSPTEELCSTAGSDTTPVYIYRGTGTDNETVESSTVVPTAAKMWKGNVGTPHIPLDKLIYNKITLMLQWMMEGTARSTIAYSIQVLNGDGDVIGPAQSKGYFSNSSITVTGVEEDFVFKLPSAGSSAEKSFYYKLTPNIQTMAGTVVSEIDITNNYIKTWGTKTVISNAGLQVMEGPYQNVRIGSGEFRTEGSLNVIHAGSTGGHINASRYLTVNADLDLNKALKPEYNLYVGSAHITGSEGSIGTTKNIVAYVSDKRLKDDVTPISTPIEKIKQIGGYNFTWGTGSVKPGEKDVGVISQEVEEIMPEVIRNFTHSGEDVKKGATAGTFKSVLYDRMVPLLVEGIKEQQDQIDYLKEQLNTIVCGSIEPQ